MTVGTAVEGLRERGKARRRDAIQRAAFRLFAEQGYEQTTLADIAAAAELAPRTIPGYFPSKIDIAVSYADEIAERLTTAFETSPRADFLTVLDRWLAAEAADLDRELARLAEAMYASNPELRAVGSAHVERAVELGSASFHAYTGLRRDDPMAAICGAALAGAITAYQQVLAARGSNTRRHADVVRYLRAILAAAAR